MGVNNEVKGYIVNTENTKTENYHGYNLQTANGNGQAAVESISLVAEEMSGKATEVADKIKSAVSQSGGQNGSGVLKNVNMEGLNVSDNAYDAASGNTGLIANEYFSNEIQGFYDTSTGQMLEVSPEDLQNVEFLKSLAQNENIVAVFGYGEKGTLEDVSGFVNLRDLQGLINESLEQQNVNNSSTGSSQNISLKDLGVGADGKIRVANKEDYENLKSICEQRGITPPSEDDVVFLDGQQNETPKAKDSYMSARTSSEKEVNSVGTGASESVIVENPDSGVTITPVSEDSYRTETTTSQTNANSGVTITPMTPVSEESYGTETTAS